VQVVHSAGTSISVYSKELTTSEDNIFYANVVTLLFDQPIYVQRNSLLNRTSLTDVNVNKFVDLFKGKVLKYCYC